MKNIYEFPSSDAEHKSSKAEIAMMPGLMDWQVNIRNRVWTPPTDVYETAEGVVVRVEIAGMKRPDFSIDFNRNVLTISGVRPDFPEKKAYFQMEIRHGEFNVSIEIPFPVDHSRIDAEYRDGFLCVRLPKAETKRIEIKTV
jgi:HSP20 family protein